MNKKMIKTEVIEIGPSTLLEKLCENLEKKTLEKFLKNPVKNKIFAKNLQFYWTKLRHGNISLNDFKFYF